MMEKAYKEVRLSIIRQKIKEILGENGILRSMNSRSRVMSTEEYLVIEHRSDFFVGIPYENIRDISVKEIDRQKSLIVDVDSGERYSMLIK